MVVMGSINTWINQRAASKGAALAFYTLFSMAPVLVLVIGIAGTVFGTHAAKEAILDQLRYLVGPSDGIKFIEMLLDNARNNPHTGRIATIVASITLLVGATSIFGELKDSLDEIWQVTKDDSSDGLFAMLKIRLLSFGLVLVLAFLLMVSLVVSAALAFISAYWKNRWAGMIMIITPLSELFSFGVIASLFAVIYKMLPHIRLSWRDVGIGALGTAILFTLGKYAIGFYLGNSGVANSYGAAGSIVILLLWVYYSAQIFFLGAVFTQQYALWYGSLKSTNKHFLSSPSPKTA
ncbi:MAG: YihY/virulence factor BrkB family protein [Pseudomonadota bacterium]